MRKPAAIPNVRPDANRRNSDRAHDAGARPYRPPASTDRHGPGAIARYPPVNPANGTCAAYPPATATLSYRAISIANSRASIADPPPSTGAHRP